MNAHYVPGIVLGSQGEKKRPSSFKEKAFSGGQIINMIIKQIPSGWEGVEQGNGGVVVLEGGAFNLR